MITQVVNQNSIKEAYKRRPGWAHKGNFGRVLVIGGSNIYTGSPTLVALAALRGGADIVKIFAPKRAADACSTFSPEIIAISYNKQTLDRDAVQPIKQMSDAFDVITIGNGLGIDDDQAELVNKLVESERKRLVIDADAIKVLKPGLLDNNMLLTPNSNEFNIIFKEKISTDLEKRVKAVEERAKQYHTNILLKGHVDIISDGDQTFINKTNSVYMTKAGTGDVLTGICAALIAQNMDILKAGAVAAFINGYTGRSVAKEKREALSPLDIINNIYSTITKWRYQ